MKISLKTIKESDEGKYMYLKNHMNFIMIYHFYQKERKKVEKLVANLHEKSEYFLPIRSLKQALNYVLDL